MVLTKLTAYRKKNLKNLKISALQMVTSTCPPVGKILWSETVLIVPLLMSFATINGTVYMAMTKLDAKKFRPTRQVRVVVYPTQNPVMQIWVGPRAEQNLKKTITGGFGQVHYIINQNSNALFTW